MATRAASLLPAAKANAPAWAIVAASAAFQSSLLATATPARVLSSSTGSASAVSTPMASSAGPAARTSTRFAAPLTTNPGMSTSAPVPTRARAERLIRREDEAVTLTVAALLVTDELPLDTRTL